MVDALVVAVFVPSGSCCAGVAPVVAGAVLSGGDTLGALSLGSGVAVFVPSGSCCAVVVHVVSDAVGVPPGAVVCVCASGDTGAVCCPVVVSCPAGVAPVVAGAVLS